MVWFLGGTAVLCLLYYIIIVIYSGVSTSFALIWPCLAIFLGLLAAGWWFGSQHEGRIPVWVGVSVGTVCATGFLILVITEVLIGWSAITATGQPADYVIVLGARVRGTKLSNSLKQRLDRAIEYSEEYPNTVLVLSGEARREDIPASPEKPVWVLPDIRAVEAVLAGRAPCPPRFPG